MDTPASAAKGGTAGAAMAGVRAGQRSESRSALPYPPRHAAVGGAGALAEPLQQYWARICAARPSVWREDRPLENDAKRFFGTLLERARAGDYDAVICFQRKNVKSGKSRQRCRAYAGATTLRDFLAKHTACKAAVKGRTTATDDLANDFSRSFVEVHQWLQTDPAPAPGGGL